MGTTVCHQSRRPVADNSFVRMSRNASDWDRALIAVRNFSLYIVASHSGSDGFAGVGLLALQRQSKVWWRILLYLVD